MNLNFLSLLLAVLAAASPVETDLLAKRQRTLLPCPQSLVQQKTEV